MYTQCPECQIAFRVTAKVLQQTSDNVRCDSCGHAFNALEYLSEDMPERALPGIDNTADEPAGELAGPDDDRLSSEELGATEEPRYDGNTPLPDNFGDDESDAPGIVPQPREQGYPLKTDELEDWQGDLALSEPEDWTDILEEVCDPTVESPEVKEELAAIHSELSTIDDALTDEVSQPDGGVPAAELDTDEIDDDVDDAAPGDDEDTDVFDVAVDDDENIEPPLADEASELEADEGDEDDDAADSTDDDIDENEADPGESFDVAATTVGVENPGPLFDESSGEVETVIMEGEFIRSEVEKVPIAAKHGTRSQLDDPATLMGTSAMNRGKVRGGQPGYDPSSLVIVAAIVGLALVLVGQFVHNHRQSLATYGFFNATIAPVYRLLGSPVTPDWDVNGWQFETTNGSIDDENTRLTIVSRIANRSSQSLPYPLVHVELTDRFDEVTGSAILEPSDYLAVDGDPGRPIAPGDNFTAMITMDDPSVEVYGYRLKVCYRTEPGAVRCAAEAFRD